MRSLRVEAFLTQRRKGLGNGIALFSYCAIFDFNRSLLIFSLLHGLFHSVFIFQGFFPIFCPLFLLTLLHVYQVFPLLD
jgi:hypothetical protein